MRTQLNILVFLIVLLLFTHLNAQNMDNNKTKNYEIVTFGSGCFWCTEAIFNLVEGVIEAVPGYSGGTEPNPSYELVCSGETGYAEVVQVTYDPELIPFKDLLEIFWETHDPTTLNRQGADMGPQYRSVIFYHTQQQKEEALYYKEQLEKEGIWKKPIVTEISPFTKFYQAEPYHLNYYENNPANGYCNYVITPKVEKFKKVFSDKLTK
ncbi:MAG: peptide-methionine (S)-S-oxide reductase [Marinilabiliales bacterium]|nr:MAG: peptide-methionine (S)-S-oxide reductase [Marinilabiliales bacterium]